MTRYILFGLLLIVGTLNREMTGFLLLSSWLMVFGLSKWRASLIYCTIALITVVGLRLFIDAENTYTLAKIWTFNTQSWRTPNAILYHTILLPMWLFIYIMRQRMATVYYRLLLIMIPYVVLALVLGIWQEIRLLLPLVLILLPLVKTKAT